MDMKLKKDMRISLLSLLDVTMKYLIRNNYYKQEWELHITPRVLMSAIDNDKVLLDILEMYLYGAYYDQVIGGVAHIRETENNHQNKQK